MKIHDFDARFFEYVQTWMAIHPGLTEQQVEDSYNEMMLSWLNAPAKWLDGETPGTYFNRYDSPRDLMKLMEEYDKRDIGLPEPLYARIVELGEICVEALMRVAADEDKPEALRTTAISLLNDIGSDAFRGLLVELVCRCEEDEIGEKAADILSDWKDASIVDELLSRYDGVGEYAQEIILDICCNFPEHPRLLELLLEKLRTSPEDRAYYASLLEKLGNPAALETLQQVLSLSDLSYLDYIEVRNAVESLGGDPGEERTFYGDPDYEAMRGV